MNGLFAPKPVLFKPGLPDREGWATMRRPVICEELPAVLT